MSEIDGPPAKTILLVEDDHVVRELTTEVLTEFGYRVDARRDATSALELLRSERHVDLLMTDIGLPGLDGRALVAAARQLRPTLPVLVASGYYEQELLEEVRARDAMAATESIVKPYDFKLLAQRLSTLAG